MDIEDKIRNAYDNDQISLKVGNELLQNMDTYGKLINAIIHKQGSLCETNELLNSIINIDEPSKLIEYLINDLNNNWSFDDLSFYVRAATNLSDILAFRDSKIEGLNTKQRAWLISMNSLYPEKKELYRDSLTSLANGVPFYIIYCFWQYTEYDLSSYKNRQKYKKYLDEGYLVSPSMLLMYYEIRYSTRVTLKAIKLFGAGVYCDQVDDIISNEHNVGSKEFICQYFN